MSRTPQAVPGTTRALLTAAPDVTWAHCLGVPANAYRELDGELVARRDGTGGFDAAGRAIAYRQNEGYEERTTYDPDRIVVRVNGRVLLETDLDDDGRPVQSRYATGELERYRYQGGRLSRSRRPLNLVEDPGLAVVRLGVTYVEGSGLFSTVSLGVDDVRADEMSFWYGIGSGGGIDEIECDVPFELERLLLREAALNDPDPAQRTVLAAVASTLARRDWTGVLTPADDFVAFIADVCEAKRR